MTDTEHGQVLHPGQKAPVSGLYECDCGTGHRYSANAAGHVLPPLPQGCSGTGWGAGDNGPVSTAMASGFRTATGARVRQLVTDADLDALDAALSGLRAAGWPARGSRPREDTKPRGRDTYRRPPSDEVSTARPAGGRLLA